MRFCKSTRRVLIVRPQVQFIQYIYELKINFIPSYMRRNVRSCHGSPLCSSRWGARGHGCVQLKCMRHPPRATFQSPRRQGWRRRKPLLLPLQQSQPLARRHRLGSGSTRTTLRLRRRGECFFTGIFMPSRIVNVSFKLKATPSRIARMTCARVCDAVRPTSAPRAFGSRCGVRSPIR